MRQDFVLIGRRVVGYVKNPVGIVVAHVPAIGAVGDNATATRLTQTETEHPIRCPNVDVGKTIMVVNVHPTGNAIQTILQRTEPANLTRQATLETNPLSVNVVAAFKLRSVPLDAGFRANNDWPKRH
jgi:hypothetical protein